MSQPTHHSYLWSDDTAASWRTILIAAARPDEQRHFATLDELYAFLIALAASSPELERMHALAADLAEETNAPLT